MFANSYSPVGFFDSHHRRQHPQPRLSPGGGGGGGGASSLSSYEERKRREEAHRRRRVEAERSLRRRRRECGQLFLAASHSSPSLLLFGAEYTTEEQHPPQSQSQPKLRSGENEEEAEIEEGDAAAVRQRREREMVLQMWPRLDDDNNEEKGCEDELQTRHRFELPPQRRNREERSLNFDEEQGEGQSFFSDDFPPSFIYASISMPQDEMNVVDKNNIATTTTTTTTSAPRKTGSMDSFFFTHPNKQDEKLKEGYILEKSVYRKEEEEGALYPKINMDIENDEDNDVVSCPPHIIAEDEEEDDDEDASNHDENEVNASHFNALWRGTTTGWNRQRASFRPR